MTESSLRAQKLPVLEVENLAVSLPPDGDRPNAVEHVSFTVNEGEVTCLIGESGSGKSVIASTVMGLLPKGLAPAEGSVKLLGMDLFRRTPDEIRRLRGAKMAMVFQEPMTALNPVMTCGDQMDELLRAHVPMGPYERRIRILDLFEEVRLPDPPRIFRSYPHQLSGGMKQKLALASALLRIPDLLLLDEPTVGVDPLSRRELWSVVRRMLADTPMTCVFSTAYLEEAEAADRVLLFESGRIIADENPQSFISRAKGRTYLLPLANRAEHDAQMLCRRLSEETAATRSDALFLDIVPRMGGAAVTTLAPTLPVKDARVPSGFVPRQPSLEDAYALLTFPRAPKTANRLASPPSDVSDTSAASAASADDTAERPVVIRADGIARKFGNFVAVADTSFEVRRGEIFGLLGPNGAGKTTTFRMLCGLLVPSKGQIEVAGYDLRTAKAGARARIGYVAQKFSLYGKLSVEQNLRYFGRSYGFFGQALQDRIDASLEDFGLTDRRDTTAGSLSFGAKRDLSMACGLIHSPEILFLDEATSGADLASRRAFWRRINALASAGTSVVVTTHFLEEAEYCDRFLIQDAGKVLALGTPREVKQRAAVLSAVSGQSLVVDRMSIEDAFVAIVEAGRRSQETPS